MDQAQHVHNAKEKAEAREDRAPQESGKEMKKKCRKHRWLDRKVKVVMEFSTAPGALNYFFPDTYPVKICVRCDRIKSK